MAKLVSKTYGEALFEVAKSEGTIDELMQETEVVLSVFRENEDYIKLLNHPRIPAAEKVDLLEQAFRGKVSDALTGLFVAVVEKRRFAEIEKILEYFASQVREYKKIGTAYVVSAAELTAEEKKQIEKKLLDTTSYESFCMNYSVDAGLLGGLVIRIGDRVVDSSIRTKLENMARSLSKIPLAR